MTTVISIKSTHFVENILKNLTETLGTTEREQVWQYKSTLELDGTPTLGLISSYSGGGYVIDLGTSLQEAADTIEYLRNTFWLDRTSRAVFTEFNLYNPATNLFSAVELVRVYEKINTLLSTIFRIIGKLTLAPIIKEIQPLVLWPRA